MEIQEYLAWKEMPQTKEFFKHLVKAKEETKELWANGAFKSEVDTQFALGGIYAINQILDLDYEDIKGAE